MARNYEVTPGQNGGYKVTKKPGMVWYFIFFIVALAALLQKDWTVKLIGAAFLLMFGASLIIKAKTRAQK